MIFTAYRKKTVDHNVATYIMKRLRVKLQYKSAINDAKETWTVDRKRKVVDNMHSGNNSSFWRQWKRICVGKSRSVKRDSIGDSVANRLLALKIYVMGSNSILKPSSMTHGRMI